jgi:hypothetical protein
VTIGVQQLDHQRASYLMHKALRLNQRRWRCSCPYTRAFAPHMFDEFIYTSQSARKIGVDHADELVLRCDKRTRLRGIVRGERWRDL